METRIHESHGYLVIDKPAITPDGDEGTSSTYYKIVMTRPHDLLKELDDITTNDGAVFGRGVVYADPDSPRSGGRGLAWRKF